MTIIPASVIIPTLDRRERLNQTIASLLAQNVRPAEIIIVDASAPTTNTQDLPTPAEGIRLRCLGATTRGAAAQRNEGVAAATQPFILFADDDIDLEPDCLATLWQTLRDDPPVGGCSAVISNQSYHPPSRIMRWLYTLLGCPRTGPLAGRCCGPALNFLPAAEGPANQAVDWVNLCCTLFRREALPSPPLLDFFHGYSLMEDTALALQVARRWRLVAPPAARIYHDMRPAPYKNRVFARERMEVVNRWFVMRCLMHQAGFAWALRQLAWQSISLALSLRHAAGWRRLPAAVAGKIAGIAIVLLRGRRWRSYPEPAIT